MAYTTLTNALHIIIYRTISRSKNHQNCGVRFKRQRPAKISAETAMEGCGDGFVQMALNRTVDSFSIVGSRDQPQIIRILLKPFSAKAVRI